MTNTDSGVYDTRSEDSYECENCGAVYNTIFPSWQLPATCYECGERHTWELTE